MLSKLGPFIKPTTIVAHSPGRINFIGEHTDYNDGFVLPAAIDKATYVAVTPRSDLEINLVSIDFNDNFFTTTETYQKTECAWANYILGVVDQFRKKDVPLKGFDLAVCGDVPIGGGLSSSAALECATALALNQLYQTNFDKLTLTKMSQLAEHEYAGVKCGIMDQFASLFGKKDHAIKLDCRSLEYDYVPIVMDHFDVVLFDTNVKHSLASSEYNLRRLECSKGVEMISQHVPNITSLRDVTIDMLERFVQPFDSLVYNRCKYVVEENLRLLGACEDLKNKDLESFGKKMFETHHGLSSLYNVSCRELDFLVDFAKNDSAVIGARMMGGGFGGCTINLVKKEAVSDFTKKITKAYAADMKRELGVHFVKIENGGSVDGLK